MLIVAVLMTGVPGMLVSNIGSIGPGHGQAKIARSL